MGEFLTAAMAPVLHDLQACGRAAPIVECRDWAQDPALASAMLWSPNGSGRGVVAVRSLPLWEQIAVIADQVQEWVIDEVREHHGANWPACPRHPDTHPLRPSTNNKVAIWLCPVDKIAIARIGHL